MRWNSCWLDRNAAPGHYHASRIRPSKQPARPAARTRGSPRFPRASDADNRGRKGDKSVILVTEAEPDNIEAIAALTEEIDRFYGATDIEPLSTRTGQIANAIFSNPPAAYALLAWNDDQLVGFAAYSFLWPAVGLTRSLYLKELYVVQACRGQGMAGYSLEPYRDRGQACVQSRRVDDGRSKPRRASLLRVARHAEEQLQSVPPPRR